MKNLFTIIFLTVLFAVFSETYAQSTDTTKAPVKHGRNFVDANGDGYNDNAPDHDGDGIPNGVDPDYTGAKVQKGKRAFVDLNGDGINDNAAQARAKRGKGYGPADGTGNKGVAPKNGSGNNPGSNDGTSNQGSGRGKKWGKK